MTDYYADSSALVKRYVVETELNTDNPNAYG